MSQPGPIRVMLVDDHKTLLWGLERLINSARPTMEVVATASSLTGILPTALHNRPDVILLDLDLNGDNALGSLPALHQQCPARVLILTGDRNPASHQAAILAGARGVLLKDENADCVLEAIAHVHAGEVWMDRQLMDRMLGLLTPRPPTQISEVGSRIASLTPREREIIAAVVGNRGAKSIVIADALHISEHTLRNHLTVIYGKLALRNRIDLYAFALENQLGTPTP